MYKTIEVITILKDLLNDTGKEVELKMNHVPPMIRAVLGFCVNSLYNALNSLNEEGMKSVLF